MSVITLSVPRRTKKNVSVRTLLGDHLLGRDRHDPLLGDLLLRMLDHHPLVRGDHHRRGDKPRQLLSEEHYLVQPASHTSPHRFQHHRERTKTYAACNRPSISSLARLLCSIGARMSFMRASCAWMNCARL